MTSTGVCRKARAAASPPNPPPTITTGPGGLDSQPTILDSHTGSSRPWCLRIESTLYRWVAAQTWLTSSSDRKKRRQAAAHDVVGGLLTWAARYGWVTEPSSGPGERLSRPKPWGQIPATSNSLAQIGSWCLCSQHARIHMWHWRDGPTHTWGYSTSTFPSLHTDTPDWHIESSYTHLTTNPQRGTLADTLPLVS